MLGHLNCLNLSQLHRTRRSLMRTQYDVLKINHLSKPGVCGDSKSAADLLKDASPFVVSHCSSLRSRLSVAFRDIICRVINVSHTNGEAIGAYCVRDVQAV